MDGEFETFVVSGILVRRRPNSTIKFRILLPFRYLEEIHPDNGMALVSFQTYSVESLNGPAAIKSKMTKVYETQAKTEIDERGAWAMVTGSYGGSAFESMHLNTEYEVCRKPVIPSTRCTAAGIALFILLVVLHQLYQHRHRAIPKSRSKRNRRAQSDRGTASVIGQFLENHSPVSPVICTLAYPPSHSPCNV